jgi:alkyl hydroperoxide reductase subunit F
MTYDLAIVGGGPAGTAAGVYASRKKLKTIFLTDEFGGQSVVSPDIQNWIGTPSISGNELAASFKQHLETYASDVLAIEKGHRVSNVEKKETVFLLITEAGAIFEARAVLITTGADRRHLTVPGADVFEHKGLTYCATCDGPLFSDKDVVVIGGGNAGFETAAQLLAYTKSVTLLNRSAEYKADAITVEKVLADPKMTGIKNADITSIVGETFVTGLTYKNLETGVEEELKAEGIFVEIGLIPTTGFVKDAVKLDAIGRIEIDPWTQRTSTEGIWAAGDCSNVRYHQNNIAAGDAVKALEDIFIWLKQNA